MDMEEQPGSISSMKNTIAKNKRIIDEAKEWTPEIQMRIEQISILECLIEAFIDLD